LVPFKTQPLSVCVAVVWSPAESEPDPGSVRPKQAISPDATRGSHSAFCASVPPFFSAEANMPMLIEMIDRKAGIA